MKSNITYVKSIAMLYKYQPIKLQGEYLSLFRLAFVFPNL